MYKIEFKLKQHTPIIHFQPNDDGATLRASELKPKFDTYLKSRPKIREEIEKFLVKNSDGQEFLPYKLQVLNNAKGVNQIDGLREYEAGSPISLFQ